ncbi:MAG: TetR/AcrR family transcriptional regulator [Synergistaceae bacterium]|nr:TetR/AcrR family transcriptional regulator [Synergistaceae bacterium]
MEIKLNKRQQKSEKNKKMIFDCAIYLFRKYGYHKVSIEDIVNASRTSVGTFYYYFKCKEELLILFLNTFAHAYYEDYEKDALATPADASVSPLKRLHDFVLFSLTLTQVGGEEFLRIAMAYLLREETGAAAYKYMLDPDRPFARICKKLIKEGQESGEIRTDKSDEELLSILSLFSNGIDERWFMSRGAFSTNDYSDLLWEFMQSMMAARER